jgi:hypothetical protein
MRMSNIPVETEFISYTTLATSPTWRTAEHSKQEELQLFAETFVWDRPDGSPQVKIMLSSFMETSGATLSNFIRLIDPTAQTEQPPESEDEIVELRDISKKQAKQEIKNLLDSIPNALDHEEIADELRLGLELVVQACTELIEEGVIEFT